MAVGGKRPGAGRPKGAVNKATADIKAIAQQYGEQAMSTLFDIMLSSENDTARIAAAKEIIDRGYGKAKQQLEAEISGGMSIQSIVRKIVDPTDSNA